MMIRTRTENGESVSASDTCSVREGKGKIHGRTCARTLEIAGSRIISNAGTPSLPRLPKPAVDPQRAASPLYSSFSLLVGIALEELEDAKRVANEFMAWTRVCGCVESG